MNIYILLITMTLNASSPFTTEIEMHDRDICFETAERLNQDDDNRSYRCQVKTIEECQL
jgi:hypothetical protein